MTATLTAEVEVEVPLSTAYNQWTQFEEFPEFLHSVKSVEQIDDERSHWTVSIGGVQREFDTTIVDQVPDDHVAWASVDERVHAGRVSFTPLAEDRTLVSVEMEWEPETLLERAGATLQLDDRQAEMDLQRFKEFIEERGEETGAWRGEIHDSMPGGPAGSGAVTAGAVGADIEEGPLSADELDAAPEDLTARPYEQ